MHTLRFLKRARSLGFSVGECRELLALYRDRRRSSADVKAVATRRRAEIERKIAELESLRRALDELIRRCHGDERPDCPIIDELAGEATAGCCQLNANGSPKCRAAGLSSRQLTPLGEGG